MDGACLGSRVGACMWDVDQYKPRSGLQGNVNNASDHGCFELIHKLSVFQASMSGLVISGHFRCGACKPLLLVERLLHEIGQNHASGCATRISWMYCFVDLYHLRIENLLPYSARPGLKACDTGHTCVD